MVVQTYPQKTTTSRIFAILGVLILIGSIAPLPGEVALEAQAQVPSGLTIVKSDYETEADEILGVDAIAYLVLNDPARSVPDVRGIVPIIITNATRGVSDNDVDGRIEIDLLETGIGTGVFKGAFGFSTSGNETTERANAHPIFGRIGVEQAGSGFVSKLSKVHVWEKGDTITATTGDDATTRSDTVEWKPAGPATIEVFDENGDLIWCESAPPGCGDGGDHAIAGVNDQFTIVVEDSDLTKSSYPDLVRVMSDSSPAGQTVSLTRTADGKYQGTVFFKTSSSGDGLLVADGDWIQARYDEPSNVEGDPVTHWIPGADASWEFKRAGPGSVVADRTTYFGITRTNNGHPSDRAVIGVSDIGESTSGSATANELTATARTGTQTATIDLRQPSGSSSLYLGTLGFQTSAESCPAAITNQFECLTVTDGATVTVEYEDSEDTLRTTTFTWQAIEEASVAVTHEGTSDDLGHDGLLFYGTSSQYTVTVDDIDASAPVTARVKTSSDPTEGTEVALSETGTTGRYTGTFTFADVTVADGDTVVVEYVDAEDETGREAVVRTSPGIWREAATLTADDISTDAMDYYQQDDTTVAPSGTLAEVIVEDPGRNHPHHRDVIQVTARHEADPSIEHAFTLWEVGIDTGLFYGLLEFGTDGLPLSGGDETSFELVYEQLDGAEIVSDPRSFWVDAPSTIVRFETTKTISPSAEDEFKWSKEIDTLLLNEACDEITVAVYGTDSLPNIDLASGGDDNDLSLAFTQDGNRDRWIATFNVDDSTDCSGDLEVDPDDTITASGTASASMDVLTENEVVAFTNLDHKSVDIDGTEVDAISGTNNAVEFQVTQLISPMNSGHRDVLEVLIDDGDSPLPLLVSETSGGSRTFIGGFQLDHVEAMHELKYPVPSNLDFLVDRTDTDEYDIFENLTISATDDEAYLHWYPSGDSSLTVSPAWGTGTFATTLTDLEGLVHRVQEVVPTDSSQTVYSVSGRFIHGSELVSISDDGDWSLLTPVNDCGTNQNYIQLSPTQIQLCDSSPADDEEIRINYVDARRTIAVVGPSEDESVTLLYSSPSEKFTLNVQRESSLGENNGRIHVSGDEAQIWFLYADPVTQFGGTAATDVPDDLLSRGEKTTWRPAQNAQVRIMTPDFSQAETSTIHGPGVPVEVRDVDSGMADRIDSVSVSIEAATGRLWETGTDTGVFQGIVNVAGPTSPISAEYTDRFSATGTAGVLRESDEVDWMGSDSGTVDICAVGPDCTVDSFHGLNDRFIVKVEDDDRTESSFSVRMVSSSDMIGQTVTVDRQSAGVYHSGPIGFKTSGSPVTGKLVVDHEDKIGVIYHDPLDSTGVASFVNSLLTSTVSWNNFADGRVSFDRKVHIGTELGALDDASDEWDGLQKMALGVVVLDDADLALGTRGTHVVSISGGMFSGGDGMFSIGDVDEINLVEAAPGTGVFLGAFSFNTVPDPVVPRVTVSPPTDSFTAFYTDPTPILAENEDDEEAQWARDGFGVVTFDKSSYTDLGTNPRVTVYDSDLTTDSVSAQVESDTDTAGISLDLQARDDAGDADDDGYVGVYTGTFSLSSSSSGSRLAVADDDIIRAIYSDISPPGSRTTEAIIGIGEDMPPVTTLVSTPSEPNGENDWFITAPTVGFETDKDASKIDTTFYRIGAGGANELEPGETFILSEGIHEITYWSVDIFDNEESEKSVEIKVSLTVPEGEVTNLETESLPGGDVVLSWEGVEIGGVAPLTYHIHRGPDGADFEDDDVERVGNSTLESFTDRPDSDDPPQRGETFQYFVVVANEAGQVSTDFVGIEGLSDRVAPEIDSFEVDVEELHEDEDEDTANAELTLVNNAENLADLQNVTLRVLDPFGNTADESEMEEESATVYQAAYNGFDTCGVYTLLGVARDGVGNEGLGNRSVRYVAIDTSAPQLRDVASQIQQGQSLNVTVLDNCAGVGSIEYSVNDGDRRTVNVPERSSGDNCNIGPCTVSFQISASRFSIGENEVRFYLADAADSVNEAVETRTIRMVALDDDDDDDDGLTAPSIDTARFTRLVEHGGDFIFSVSGSSLSRLDFDGNSVIGGLGSGGRVLVDIGDYEPGEHTVTVQVENLLGSDRHDFTFHVLDEGIPLPPINVQVTKDDLGRPVVSWQANPDSQAELGGYIIHRAASPWRVIGIVDADTTSFTDLTAVGKTSYQYAVTSYGPGGQGLLAEGDDSAESLPWFQGVQTSTFETDDISSGIPAIVWWVALVAVAVLLVVGLIYANRRQIFGRREEELYTEDYPDEAETPFGEERHLIECPNCTTEFHVAGERPVVTNCPNCGRKGILR